MQAVILALLSAFFFGISNTYWKTASRTSNFPTLVFFRGILASIIFVLIWIYLAQTSTTATYFINPATTGSQYLRTALLCIFCSFGLISYLLSLKYTAVSLSVPISSINWASILTAVFILGETFKTVYFFSFGLGMIGLLLTQAYKIEKGGLQWNRGATYSLMASFFWGVSYSLFKFTVPWVGAIPMAAMLEATVTLAALVWMLIQPMEGFRKKVIFSITNLRNYIVLAFLLIGGTLFFNLAIQQIPILVANVLGYFTIVVSIITGILFYREKLNYKQVSGIALIIVSIIVIQLFK